MSNMGAPLLDEAHALFLARPVGITIGSCNAARVPSLARALGCRVAPDRRSVTVFVAEAHAEALLRDLRAGGGVAAVFSWPPTHETLQLKGESAHVTALSTEDYAHMRSYRRGFADALRNLGYSDSIADAIVPVVEKDVVGIVFAPVAAFNQTPGPAAGQPLVPRP
jgi:hypothetical protein